MPPIPEREDAEFADCVHRDLQHESSVDAVEIVGTVDEKVV